MAVAARDRATATAWDAPRPSICPTVCSALRLPASSTSPTGATTSCASSQLQAARSHGWREAAARAASTLASPTARAAQPHFPTPAALPSRRPRKRCSSPTLEATAFAPSPSPRRLLSRWLAAAVAWGRWPGTLTASASRQPFQGPTVHHFARPLACYTWATPTPTSSAQSTRLLAPSTLLPAAARAGQAPAVLTASAARRHSIACTSLLVTLPEPFFTSQITATVSSVRLTLPAPQWQHSLVAVVPVAQTLGA